MAEDIYSAADVIDKTLFAVSSVPIFNGFPDKNYMPKKIGTVAAGETVGKVYSYITADPGANRPRLWWMFYPGSAFGDGYYFAEHVPGVFDLDALRAQGVKTVQETEEEKKKKEEEENKTWYEKLADKVLPILAGAIVGAAIIGAVGRTAGGLLSGKKSE